MSETLISELIKNAAVPANKLPKTRLVDNSNDLPKKPTLDDITTVWLMSPRTRNTTSPLIPSISLVPIDTPVDPYAIPETDGDRFYKRILA